MSSVLILVLTCAAFISAYFFYGGWLGKKWGIDKKRITPAHMRYDGNDYAPASRRVIFGHQFASIAGAGPINGPIIAAMFGWVPALLWIVFGGIFIGGVQDFVSMFASVRNDGKSVGSIVEKYLGKWGKTLFLLFIWLFSILVIAAFADIVAGTFGGFDAAGEKNSAGGSVAMTSILFIAAAVALGFIIKKLKKKPAAGAFIAIAMLALCILVGLLVPVYLKSNIWLYLIFAYIFIASIAPVSVLLQPRDYLNSFLLIFMIAAAVLGVLFANPTMNLPAFTGFNVNGNFLFPALFVTIACGAVSGFHSLIASGTASKQISNEADIKPVSYGAMLIECVLAVLALIAVGSLASGGSMPSGTPPVIFATAVSGFLVTIGLPYDAVYTLILLAISAFALTSLDSVARIGRLSFQEIFASEKNNKERSKFFKILTNKYFATGITLLLGYLLSVAGYQNIWPLFGSANQLLAALALLACALFLKETKRKGIMLYIPMGIMIIITFAALTLNIYNLFAKIGAGTFQAGDALQIIFAVILFALGVIVAVAGIRKLLKKSIPQARNDTEQCSE